jgi:acid stress chaperone HdeB
VQRFRLRLRRWSGESLPADLSHKPFLLWRFAPMEIPMKTTLSILFAAALSLTSMPAHAVKWDLSTMTCKQFLESGEDNIAVVLTWMDGWYKGDEDNAIIDTEVFIENAKKFGAYCGKNPTVSVVTAADEILGK